MPARLLNCLCLLVAGMATVAAQNPKFVVARTDIPLGGKLVPQQQQPVFAVCSKQGMRVLVSRDDGRTWQQTFLATDSQEDGGWHGTYTVYGMAATDGVIGVFSGWGTPGTYIGSDDGRNWSHLNREPVKLGSVWGAAAGNGVMLTSADQWRGLTSWHVNDASLQTHSLKDLLNGGKTHHIISGFGDYQGGRFVAIGDNRHVFFSKDNCQTWTHSLIPEGVGDRGQQAIRYGNGVFLCSYKDKVARSADGGQTWTLHDHGLAETASWRSLSFVNEEFWLTGRKGGGRRSKDGIVWQDLPEQTPAGRFVQSVDGTIINVGRGRYDIKRSTDGLRWQTVFTAPQEDDVTWDMAFAIHSKVKRLTKTASE